jgi:hypothetical protein
MPTTAYNNWIAKTRECGLANEQACGLAMLHSWTLTHRESHDDVSDNLSFGAFVEKKELDRIKKTSFSVDDFLRFPESPRGNSAGRFH